MKKIILFALVVCFITGLAYADMPGNKPRPDVYLHVITTDSVKQYNFFYKGDYSEADSTLSDTIWLNGGMGKPYGVTIWGIHKKTKQSTDTIFFDNSGNHIIATINNVTAGKIQFSEAALTVGNDYTETSEDQQESAAPSPEKSNLLLYLSSAALVLLIVYFIAKRRKSK